MKIPHPHVKKSKILLGKAGVITTIQEESPPPPPKETTKDPYNLSNDEYYEAKSSERMIKMALGGGVIQHSTPVVELHHPVVSREGLQCHRCDIMTVRNMPRYHVWCNISAVTLHSCCLEVVII